MGRIIPYILENKKCSKPPTSNVLNLYPHGKVIKCIFLEQMVDVTRGYDFVPAHPSTMLLGRMKSRRVASTSHIFLNLNVKFADELWLGKIICSVQIDTQSQLIPNHNPMQSSGYGSIPINTIFSGMNIHLPAILGFTRYQGFDPSPSVNHAICR